MGEKGNVQDTTGGYDLWTVSDPSQGEYFRQHPEEYHNEPVGPRYWVQDDNHGFGIYQDANGDRWTLTADAAHPWVVDSLLKDRDPHAWRSLSPANDAQWRAEHPDLP